MNLDQQLQKISFVICDVDGVLTDGGIVFDNNGIETKKFHIRDGLGIKLWQRAGHRFGLITGRTSHVVQVRADELGIDIVRQGFDDKLPAARELIKEQGVAKEEVCYIGDDLPDLPVLRYVGVGVAVADAAEEVKSGADYVTELAGGHGAVREVLERILKVQGRWDELVRRYTGQLPVQ